MFSAKARQDQKRRLASRKFDVVIIGGGITGAGIALDAASRGMTVALLEMQDFAAGTSSRSTKLVHGGLRYLKQFEIKLVADVGREREIVYENAVHVTEPEWMLLPFHEGGNFGPFSTSIGLRVYDYLAGVKKQERRKMLSAEKTLRKEPLLKEEGLKGGGYYVEYRTDDARLTLETLKKAASFGAVCLNYTKAESFIYNQGQVIGVAATDQVTGEAIDVYGSVVVNAAGPWVDEVRNQDKKADKKSLILTKGVHVVIDQKKFPLQQAVYFDTPDGRMIFAIPRSGKAYVGTTDTFYETDPKLPAATQEDVDYLINAIHYMFPKVQLTPEDVESTWAGVRPLIYEEGLDPSEISRKDEIWVSDSGLMSIAGGKLTGYRKMGETITDQVAKALKKKVGRTYGKSRTKNLPLSGGDFGGSKGYARFVQQAAEDAPSFGLTKEEGQQFAQFFGTNAYRIFEIYETLGEDQLPKTLRALLHYSVEEEMTLTPSDFFIRRTGDLYFHIHDVFRLKDDVLNYMAELLDYSEEQKARYRAELEHELTVASQFGKGRDV